MLKRKFNVNPTNVKDFLPHGYKLKVRHWHRANDPDGFVRGALKNGNGRHTPVYLTIAEVGVRNRNGDFEPVTHGISSCSPKDQPNRHIGWRIAAGRALRRLHGRR